ncbi:hypothetical protein Aperf_G00000033090 [Anoplocephala perfoliata]
MVSKGNDFSESKGKSVQNVNADSDENTLRFGEYVLTHTPCSDESDIKKAFPFNTMNTIKRCQQLIQSCLTEEETTKLYKLFKEQKLAVSEDQFSGTASELESRVLWHYNEKTGEMAQAVLYACGISTPFKRACCLTCRLLEKNRIAGFVEMVKKFSVFWFDKLPEDLENLRSSDPNLFRHYYKGEGGSESSETGKARYVNISGMHWGCKFWQEYTKKTLPALTLMSFLANVNLGIFQAVEKTKHTVLFGVSIAFEMVVIFTTAHYNLNYVEVHEKGLELKIRYSDKTDLIKTGKVATAYFTNSFP